MKKTGEGRLQLYSQAYSGSLGHFIITFFFVLLNHRYLYKKASSAAALNSSVIVHRT